MTENKLKIMTPKKEDKLKDEAKGIKKKSRKEPVGKKSRTGTKGEEAYDPWKVLLHPYLAEKSMTMVEFQNKLTFIVNKKADKQTIREAVERGFNVDVKSVNVEITMKGMKKAYVTLSSKHSAADIATRLGMI